MRVLLTQKLPPPAQDAAWALTHAGHGVYYCHGSHNWTQCVVELGGRCPLDSAPVDVVVAVRRGDDGARCAARRKVPVVAFSSADTIAGAVVSVAGRPMHAHSLAATEAFRHNLRAAGLAPDATVTVHRRDAYLRVSIDAPFAIPEPVARLGAAHVCQVLRELDPDARGIDVVSPRVVARD